MIADKTSIALNVSRARLTVIGFIITLDIFALGIFAARESLDFSVLLKLGTFYPLFASICIGAVAAQLMLISERFDSQGNSDVYIFGFAEMTMYVAIVQTISGICKGFVTWFYTHLGEPAISTLNSGSDIELLEVGQTFNSMVFWLVAITWSFIVYVAPVWSIHRLPDGRSPKFYYLGYYAILTCLAFCLSAYALHIEQLAHGRSVGVLQLFLQSFWTPGLWLDLLQAR